MPSAIRLHGHPSAVLTEDAVIVVDEEARGHLISGRLSDLLLHPGQRRIAGDVDVNDAPRADLHDDEDVGDDEEGGVLGQEVTGHTALPWLRMKVRQVWFPRGVLDRGIM